MRRRIWKEKSKKKRMKYVEGEGRIPRTRGFPKNHKKSMGIRPVVNSKDTILEKLEEEIDNVFTIINERLERKTIKKQRGGGRRMKRNNIR